MTALDAMQAKLRQDGDSRARSAKQADALVEICRQSLAHDHTRHSKRRRGLPHLSTVVDLQAFETDHPDLVADIRAEAEHVGRLSRATLERLSCDCEIISDHHRRSRVTSSTSAGPRGPCPTSSGARS